MVFPYAFSDKRQIRDELVRILRRISARLQKIKPRPSADALHETRTLIKLLRALLWLAKPNLSAAATAEIKRQLRHAAGALAGPRDSGVLRSTLQELSSKNGGPKKKEAFRLAFRRAAPKAPEKASELRPMLQHSVTEVRKAICELEEKVGATDSWKSPRKRLRRAFEKTATARRDALHEGEAVRFHEWRKKAKRLLYLLEVLEPRLGSKGARTIRKADKVQNYLGDYHDNVVLEQKLTGEIHRPSDKKRIKPLRKLLKKRRRSLKKKAVKSSRKLRKP